MGVLVWGLHKIPVLIGKESQLTYTIAPCSWEMGHSLRPKGLFPQLLPCLVVYLLYNF
jgi:hypothetical protein